MKNYLISASVAISALVMQSCGTAQSIKQEASSDEPLSVILMIVLFILETEIQTLNGLRP